MKKGWETKTIGDVLIKTETINPLQSPAAEFEYIDVSSVSNKTFSIEETQQLKGKDAPSRARQLVRANDILFATIRHYSASQSFLMNSTSRFAALAISSCGQSPN